MISNYKCNLFFMERKDNQINTGIFQIFLTLGFTILSQGYYDITNTGHNHLENKRI